MQRITASYTTEETIKKSRFIGFLEPSMSETEVTKCLRQLHNDHPHATHIAYAYRLKTDNGITGRYHDAGEPSGTAGKPIYQHLEGRDLINSLIAVIRYYGGIKLGAGGLTRAYGGVARKVLELADLQPYLELTRHDMVLDYNQIQSLEHVLKTLNGHILSEVFTEQVRLTVELPITNLDKLIEVFIHHKR